MSDRLVAAVAELVDALREELAIAPATAPEQLLSTTLAAERLGIGRSALYGEIAAGRLRTVTIGRRRLVPAGAIASYVNGDVGRREANARSAST